MARQNPLDFLRAYMAEESSKESPLYKYLNPEFSFDDNRSVLAKTYGELQNPLELAQQYTSQYYTDLPKYTQPSYFANISAGLGQDYAQNLDFTRAQQQQAYAKAKGGLAEEYQNLKNKPDVTPEELSRFKEESEAIRSSYLTPLSQGRGYTAAQKKLQSLASRIATKEGQIARMESGGSGLSSRDGSYEKRQYKELKALKKYAQSLYDQYSTASAAELTGAPLADPYADAQRRRERMRPQKEYQDELYRIRTR